MLRATNPNDLLVGPGRIKVGSDKLQAVRPNDLFVSKRGRM